MLTFNFMLFLLIAIFALGFFIAIIVDLCTNKKNKDISKSFSENKIYRKFTDENDPCIDDVVNDFKLLDD
ncbi:MAG: hypothetical protein HFJ41_01375 [Clostridia bacterium]|nr:hypothetical protein [Clostridia bacterium]